ncbi:MAG: hypothetical protein N3A69_17240, partial [Leptospiraceae bacterium]|nr:hypothetical protein [Leptospiraceae bacterium]
MIKKVATYFTTVDINKLKKTFLICYSWKKKFENLKENLKILIINILFFFVSCSSLLKPNLYLLDDKFELLQRDTLFIVTTSQNKITLFEDKDLIQYEMKLKTLNPISNPNLYSIYALKSGNVQLAETTWWNRLESGEITSFFNLLRTFYLLDDKEGIKRLFEKFYQKKNFSFIKAKPTLEILSSQIRLEELILVLDYISNNIELEILERIQIGNYYLNYGELEKAKKEFEKILLVYSFQKEALEGMIKVYFHENNNETSNMFLKTYLSFYKPIEEFILIGMENFYKLKLYQEGIELSKKISKPQNKEKYFSLLKALYYS